MLTPVRLTLVFLFITSLTGCTFHFSVPPGEPLHLDVFNSRDLVLERQVEMNDPVRAAISSWLAANSNGWSYAFRTPDQRIFLAGNNFHINVRENDVSVKYCKGFYNCHLWVKQDNTLFATLQKLIGSDSMLTAPKVPDSR